MSGQYANNLMVYKTLVGLGVPQKTAAGAVGSLMGESGGTLRNNAFRKDDAGPGQHSYGWGQWNRERADSLFNTAKELGTTWNDPVAMNQHIKNELQGPYKHVLEALKKTDDVGYGNDVWTRSYEVPANAESQVFKRQANAQKMWDVVSNGEPTQVASNDPGFSPSITPVAPKPPNDIGYGALAPAPMVIQSPGALGMGPQGLQVGNMQAGMPEAPMTLPQHGSLSMTPEIGTGALGGPGALSMLAGLGGGAGAGGGEQEMQTNHASQHNAQLKRGPNGSKQLQAQKEQQRQQKDAMMIAAFNPQPSQKPILSRFS